MYITSVPYSERFNHIEIGENATVYVDTVIPKEGLLALLGAVLTALFRKIIHKPIHTGFYHE